MAPKPVLDKQIKKALLEAREMITDISKKDANEAETRRRVERFFESLMGYDVFSHITREHAIHGIADTEHCDFAIQLENGDKVKPAILVELKKVNVDLSAKHLKQVASYAINIGCEWVLLTNGRDWQLYHISFEQPPQTTLLESWHLMTDDLPVLAEKFELISYKCVKRGALDQIWQKRNVLTPRNILKVVLSEPSLSMIRRELKRAAGITLLPEDIVSAIRRLLNESALAEIEALKISLPSAKPKAIPKPKTLPQKTVALEAPIEQNKN